MTPTDERDELFEEAAALVVELRRVTLSELQRRLGVGYVRATRILAELRAAGRIDDEGCAAACNV